MNWYRVLTQHDNFKVNDMVLLDGGEREAALEQRGYLKFVSVDQGTPPGPSDPAPEFLQLEPATKDEAVAPKRGRRGKSFEAGPPESQPVEQVPGDEARGDDVSSH